MTSKTGEKIAQAEPIAGRLPANHAYAGEEFPRSALPKRFRERGLRFKETGYPEVEPYAKTLPNGQKKVHIDYQGTRPKDVVAANKAAGLEEQPEGWIWHHDEADFGAMYLVPEDLHEAVRHSGGVATYRHQHGVTAYGK